MHRQSLVQRLAEQWRRAMHWVAMRIDPPCFDVVIMAKGWQPSVPPVARIEPTSDTTSQLARIRRQVHLDPLDLPRFSSLSAPCDPWLVDGRIEGWEDRPNETEEITMPLPSVRHKRFMEAIEALRRPAQFGDVQ